MLNLHFRTILAVALLVAVVQPHEEEIDVEPSCSSTKPEEIMLHLSTKTPYRVVANMDETQPIFAGCRATRIWSVIRHGSRNPSKKHIHQARTELMRLKEAILQTPGTKLCREELARLRFWYFNVTEEEEKFLVAEGEDELIELAERMQNRFPLLLKDSYHPDSYYFKYTKTQRTLESARSFATGIFGRQHINEIIYPEALHKDPVLRFYKLCNRWKIDVDKNPETFDNARRFLDGPEIRDAIAFMQRKTQLREPLTAQQAQLIYTICAFETAWERRRPPSVWCSLFTGETIKALEFAEDLEYYWNDGYGYELTHKIACPAIGDMFEAIDPSSAKPNATFYFTHSGTVLKMLAHLRLYKDAEPLTYKDYQRQRLWRTSAIDAFASNIAFVLYECDHTEPMVLTLHQERPVRLAGCPATSDLCPLQQMRKVFADSLESCDFQALCAAAEAN